MPMRLSKKKNTLNRLLLFITLLITNFRVFNKNLSHKNLKSSSLLDFLREMRRKKIKKYKK
jgi:hypothetical protein